MRKWINLIENQSPRTVQDVAAWLASVNDDILPDDFLDCDYTTASDADCWNLIKRVYHSGSCEEFALAVNDIYGWNIFTVRDATNPTMYHCINQTADKRYCDVTGIVTLKELKRRYKMRSPQLAPYPGGFFHADDYDDDGAIGLAKWVVDNLGYEPFW